MRIILTIKSLIRLVGGAERSLIELANALKTRGHHVLIVNYESNITSGDMPFYALDSEIKIKTIWHENPPIELKEPEGFKHSFWKKHFEMSFKEYDIKVRIFIFSFIINIFLIRRIIRMIDFNLFSIFKNKKLLLIDTKNSTKVDPELAAWLTQNNAEISLWRKSIMEEAPDVVISFMPSSFVYIAQAIKHTNIPLITANRNDPYSHNVMYFNTDTFLNSLIHDAVKISHANIVQVNAYKEYFEIKNPGKTYIIPNPIYPVDIDNLIKHTEFEQKKTIICIGRMARQKNQLTLIKAFIKISHFYKNWQLLIYGLDGGYKKDLEDLIFEFNIQNQVFIKEPIKNILEELSHADIFILPSLYEGFSRALGESMAVGLPSIVIEDCVSNKELVTEGKCGLIAKNTCSDIAEKIELLITNQQLRLELGNNGKRYIKKFEPYRIYDMWEDVFNKVINEKNEFSR